jgi:hypothetical protein
MLMLRRPISSTDPVRDANGQPPARKAGPGAGSSVVANGNVRSLAVFGCSSRTHPRLAEVGLCAATSKFIPKRVVYLS